MTDDAPGLASDDDSALLRRARRDPAAFACFYRRHVRTVHAKCARGVDDDQLALDLTAEVFARALERVHRFRGVRTESGAAWIHSIADRLLLDHYRARRIADRATRRLAIRIPALADDDLDLTRLFSGESAAGLADALSALPDRQREAVCLRFVDDLSYAEIAGRFGISQEATRQHVSRGLRTLKHQLSEETP